MALIKCPECSTQVSDKAASCPSCGCPISQPSLIAVASSQTTNNSAPINSTSLVHLSKSRGIYIILGILFGGLGFHNFYAGYYLLGGIKFGVLMVVFFLDATTGFYSAFSLIALIVFTLWALIEIFVVTSDASGNKMT